MNWSTDYTELPETTQRKPIPPLTHFQKLLAKAKKDHFTPADYARASGLPYPTCWRILTGKVARPSMDHVVALAKALKVPLKIKLVL